MKERTVNWVEKVLRLTILEWFCLLGAALLLCCYLPIPLWHKSLIFLGNIVILYLLLIVTKTVWKQDKEEEIVSSIETYLESYLEDIDLQSASHPLDMVIEGLRDWTRLPGEMKYTK